VAEVDTPLVTGTNGKTRKPRQGDVALVKCVRCSTEDHPVYCRATSTAPGGLYTYFQCPVCLDRPPKRPNYNLLRRFSSQYHQEDFNARP